MKVEKKYLLEIEQKLSKRAYFSIFMKWKNLSYKNETGELFSIFDPQPSYMTIEPKLQIFATMWTQDDWICVDLFDFRRR